MANTGVKGIDIRQTGTALVFRVFMQTSAGAKETAGPVALSIYELQSDGTLKSYDFNDNTFKTTALTTATASMTHQKGNNATVNTGIWTYALSTLTGFTSGAIYIAQTNDASASPTDQTREFQFGGAEGDLAVTSNGTGVAEINTDVRMLLGTAWLTPSVAGTPDVNVKQYAGATAAVGSDNLPKVSLWSILGSALSETVGGYLAAAYKKFFNVATPTLTTAGIDQTGDSFARIGATGSGLTSLAPASTALSSATWTNALATAINTLAGHDPGGTLASAASQTSILNAVGTPMQAGTSVVLAANGLDAVLIESGITASAALVNDAGTQLTSVNLRQAIAVLTAVLAGLDSGGGTGNIVFHPAGLPSANARVTTSGADSNGNRGSVSLRVPT